MRASSSAAPDTLDLILLGGGHSHLSVLRRLVMRPWPGVRVTLVTRDVHTPYSGMLPGLVAGRYDFDATHIDLGPLARAGGVRLIHAAAQGLDLQQQRVLLPDRPALRYDLLSINTGAAPALDGVPGAREHALPVKPISELLPRLQLLLEQVRQTAAAGNALSVAVVGAGAGGVELVLALQQRLQQERLRDHVRLSLVSSGEILDGHGPAVVARFRTALAAADVEVVSGFRVVEVTARALLDGAGQRHDCDVPLWVTQAAAPPWLAASGLDVDAQGFAQVGPTLQSTSHPDVFVAGDSAAFTHVERPRSGVFAVRAGPVLADNLERQVRGRRLREFWPQQRALYLISTGAGRAVASRPGWPAFSGRWVWWWKHWIDSRFVRRFSELPRAAAAPEPSIVAGAATPETVRCAGCGSKVGAAALGSALQRLADDVGDQPPAFEDAVQLRVGDATLLQSVDGFRLPVTDPWLGGRIAALHALGDIQAMGGRAVGALALSTVPFAGGRQMEDDLFQMLAGAQHELQLADCPLLGGHSNEGEALALALTINGRSDGPLWSKRGLREGDVLVLTRPLGAGVLLAGAMQGLVRSRHVDHAIATMVQGHARVLDALRGLDVHAATDVTGFGLLGHLQEMLAADPLHVLLDVDAVPAYPGALAALETGLASSLQADNARALMGCDLQGLSTVDPRVQLLCDPQTCGGLLLALGAADADALLQRLDGQRGDVAVIGTVAASATGDARVQLGCDPTTLAHDRVN